MSPGRLHDLGDHASHALLDRRIHALLAPMRARLGDRVVAGEPERTSELRAALLEGNCGWAPWFVQRLDEHWEWVGAMDAPELDRPPREIGRTQSRCSGRSDAPQ